MVGSDVLAALGSAQPPQQLRPQGDMAAMRRTAEDFESMALQNLLAIMTDTADMSDSVFGGGAGERAFRPMLTEQYANAFAKQGGIGIADAVMAQMVQIQEQARNGG